MARLGAHIPHIFTVTGPAAIAMEPVVRAGIPASPFDPDPAGCAPRRHPPNGRRTKIPRRENATMKVVLERHVSARLRSRLAIAEHFRGCGFAPVRASSTVSAYGDARRARPRPPATPGGPSTRPPAAMPLGRTERLCTAEARSDPSAHSPKRRVVSRDFARI